MANIFNKMVNSLNILGGNEVDDEEEFIETANEEPEHRIKRGKVVNINTTTQLKVVVVSPEGFEESKEIAEHLKQQKPVVINLENVERDVARRIVDFLSGAVFALGGNFQKISAGIFLIAPSNIGIMGDFKDELKNKGVFNWNY